MFGYCFPQLYLVGVVMVYISKYKARAVVVVPNTRPGVVVFDDKESSVRSVQITSQGEDSQFLRAHHQRGAELACER